MVGVALGISAWGVVAGVAMANSSLGTAWAIVMSLLVFSGTGQIASLPLIASGAPLWVVWATVLCVNLRFVIFSLQWRPYWVHLPLRWRLTVAYFSADLNYVTFVRRFPKPEPAPEQWPYFWGGMAHDLGITVEGELGCLGSLETMKGDKEDGHGAEGTMTREQLLTDPEQAADFVKRTQLDALAIAIGTSHGAYKFTRKPTGDILAIGRIKQIHACRGTCAPRLRAARRRIRRPAGRP